jgi:hypothetical protein
MREWASQLPEVPKLPNIHEIGNNFYRRGRRGGIGRSGLQPVSRELPGAAWQGTLCRGPSTSRQ